MKPPKPCGAECCGPRAKLSIMGLPERQRRYFTPEEYLELERKADFKSEYFDGEIYPMGEWQREPKSGRIVCMAGASPAHNTICSNAHGSLYSQLRGKPCQTWSQDLRVKTPRTNLYTYPDVLVACPPHEWDDTLKDTLINPIVLIEILSPSTQSYDLNGKWDHYREMVSLRHYLVVWQDQRRVRHFSRQGENSWLQEEFSALEDQVNLSAIECTISLANLYERLDVGD